MGIYKITSVSLLLCACSGAQPNHQKLSELVPLPVPEGSQSNVVEKPLDEPTLSTDVDEGSQTKDQLIQHILVGDMLNKAGLTVEVNDYLSMLVRQATSHLSKERFGVLTKDNLYAHLPEGKSVEEINQRSGVETARDIGTEWLITSEVLRFSGELRVYMSLYHVESGELKRSELLKLKSLKHIEAPLQALTHTLLSDLDPHIDRGIETDSDAVEPEVQEQATIPQQMIEELEVERAELTEEEIKKLETSWTAEQKRTGLSWNWIQEGSFAMGSRDGKQDERPVRWVYVPQFWMTQTEVTVAQYRKCVEADVCSIPHSDQGCNWGLSGREHHPINCVSWGQARTYAKWVGKDVDLPTEAEWEYVARASQAYPFAGSNDADLVACYSFNSPSSTCQVAQKEPNQFGVYDLSGNVWEWTLDEYQATYEGAPNNGSKATGVHSMCVTHCLNEGTQRVVRGGSWDDTPDDLRLSYRYRFPPNTQDSHQGFRVKRTGRTP